MTTSNLRQRLADAKTALREQEQHLETAKAIAETEAINLVDGKYGSNDTDRKRFLTIALAQNFDYDGALAYTNELRATVDQLSAEIATMDDDRAAARLATQERMSAAIDHFASALERLSTMPPTVAAAALGVEDWHQR